MTIDQQSNQAIIEWNSFENNTVTFSSSASALNRLSQLAGALNQW